MKKAIFILILLLPMPILFACSNKDLTEQQIFEILKNDSIIAKNDFLELRTVSIKSSLWVDNKFRALLQIDFLNNQETAKWSGKGKKDFIPFGMKIFKGMNSVEVTATFSVSYAGDGSWYIESFSF